jgi:hypothetical protein
LGGWKAILFKELANGLNVPRPFYKMRGVIEKA